MKKVMTLTQYPLLTDDNIADENLDKLNSLLMSVSHTKTNRIICFKSWIKMF